MYLLDKLCGYKDGSVDGLIAWLETQDPNTEYDWLKPSGCVLGQYGKTVAGRSKPYWQQTWFQKHPDLYLIEGAAMGQTGAQTEWTFGKALTRFKALRAGNWGYGANAHYA